MATYTGHLEAQSFLDTYLRASELDFDPPVPGPLTCSRLRATIEASDGSGQIEVAVVSFSGVLQDSEDGESRGRLSLPLEYLEDVKARVGGTMRVWGERVAISGTVEESRDIITAPIDSMKWNRGKALEVSSPVVSWSNPNPYVGVPGDALDRQRPGDYIIDRSSVGWTIEQRVRKQKWEKGYPEETTKDEPRDLTEVFS